jgi:hypothetical protein
MGKVVERIVCEKVNNAALRPTAISAIAESVRGTAFFPRRCNAVSSRAMYAAARNAILRPIRHEAELSRKSCP